MGVFLRVYVSMCECQRVRVCMPVRVSFCEKYGYKAEITIRIKLSAIRETILATTYFFFLKIILILKIFKNKLN